jgi:hypothetical protein
MSRLRLGDDVRSWRIADIEMGELLDVTSAARGI